MEKVLRLFFPLTKEPRPGTLRELQAQIEAARTRFAVAASDEETEAAIYELAALEKRYDLLLRRTREE